MADRPRRRERRRLRRGVLLALVVLVVAAGAVAAVLVVRSRQAERSAEELCARLTEAQDLEQSLTTLDPATLDPQVRALRRAAQVAPADIEGPVSTLSSFVGALAAEVDAAPGDRDEALTAALEARQDEVDEVTAAGEAVQAWAAANCGLDLSGTAPTTTTSEAPPEGSTP